MSTPTPPTVATTATPRPAGWLRRHLWPVTGGSLLMAVLALFGVRWYALGEWEAAKQAVEDGKAGEALTRLKVCDAVWPFSPEVQWLGARASRLTNDYRTAEARLNRARELQGGTTEAVQLEFLLLRLQGGEVDQVGPVLGRWLEEKHPDSPAILETMALAYLRLHRYQPAYLALTKWIELRPNTVRAYLQRGWVLERMNHAQSAMNDYQKALGLDPNQPDALLRVAEMYLEDKKPDDARPYLERRLALTPDDPRVKSRLGLSRMHQGRNDEARTLLEEALPALPGDPVVVVALARLDKNDGRYADAERRLHGVLADDPSDTEALYVLADVYREQGREAEAAAQLKLHDEHTARMKRVNEKLEKLMENDKGTADDFVDVAEQFLLLNRTDLRRVGIHYMNKALEKNPTHQRAHRLLVAFYEKVNEPEEAAYHRQFVRDSMPQK